MYDSARIFKFKYLPRKGFVKHDGNQDPKIRENFNYKDYDTAISEYDLNKLRLVYKKRIQNYLTRIDKLFDLSKKLSPNPIFITNITALGYQEDALIFNISLMEHCKKKNYQCIDLAKKLDVNVNYWKDNVHTTKAGSKAIADLIFSDLKKIIFN